MRYISGKRRVEAFNVISVLKKLFVYEEIFFRFECSIRYCCFCHSFSGCMQQQTSRNSDSDNVSAPNTGVARIVYINTDTLMNQYLLAIELNEAFLKNRRNGGPN